MAVQPYASFASGSHSRRSSTLQAPYNEVVVENVNENEPISSAQGGTLPGKPIRTIGYSQVLSEDKVGRLPLHQYYENLDKNNSNRPQVTADINLGCDLP